MARETQLSNQYIPSHAATSFVVDRFHCISRAETKAIIFHYFQIEAT